MSDPAICSPVCPPPDSTLPASPPPAFDPLVGELPLSLLMVRRGFPASVVYANASARTLAGRTDLGIQSMAFHAFCDRYLSPGDRAPVREAVDVGIARAFPVRFTLDGGLSIPVSFEVAPLPDTHGLISHCAIIITGPIPPERCPPRPPGQTSRRPDFSAATDANAAALLASACEALPIGVALLDPQGNIAVANRAFARCLNQSGEFSGDSPSLATASPELDQAVRSPASQLTPLTLPSANGPATVVDLTVAALSTDSHGWRVVAVQDVRERETHRARREEERRLESLGTFANGIAHDFNNLLTIILGYGGLIREQTTSPESLQRATQAILDAGRRGADLVRQLQLFSHQHPPDLHPTDVHALIEQAIAETFPDSSRGTTLIRDFTPLPHVVALDASQVLLGLRHLLLHGRDAMDETSTLTVRTRLKGEPASAVADLPETLVVSISDDRLELDEATRSRLFDPFSAPQSRAGSRGIGLAVLYGILRAHRGRVEVSTERDGGTCIALHFPCRCTSPDTPKAEPESPQRNPVPGTVLIVEDEVDIGRLWEGLFTSHGIPYFWARDGDEAITLFRRHSDEIALLFTDVGLPGMNGWQVAKALREMNPALPILITSGAFQPTDRASSGLAEPVVCLSKPFFPSNVIQHLHRLIASPATRSSPSCA